MGEKKSTVAIIAIVVIIFLCSCVVLSSLLIWGLYLRDRNSTKDGDVILPTPAIENESSDENSTTEPDTSDTSSQTTLGTITGQVTYPSEFIPEGMTICAENVTTGEAICTTEIVVDSLDTEYDYQGSTAPYYSYTLEIPPGNYYVYAYDADGDEDYKAYYSEFVTCGLSVECESHDIIMVTVEAGDEQTEIDPGDWYAP